MQNTSLIALAGASIVVAWLARTTLELRRLFRVVRGHPIFPILISPWIPLPLPEIKFVLADRLHAWRVKHKFFEQSGSDVAAIASALPGPMVVYHTADPVTIKEVMLSRVKFIKPVEFYGIVDAYGPNIVASEGELWKRHRKPTAPAFSEKNNKLAWDEAIDIVMGMFNSQEWRGKDVVHITHAVDITLPLALFVIGRAGFGRRVSWDDDLIIPPGHKATFKDALHTVSMNLLVKLFVPKWAMPLWRPWARVGTAFDELQTYMQEMVVQRRTAAIKEERYDLFSGLLDASDADDAKSRLTDAEVIGNIFMFLIAGHETTAHTLAFCLGLLGLDQNVQDKLHAHVTGLMPGGHMPGYEEFSKFDYTLAVLYETLRLYPAVLGIGKKSTEDQVIPSRGGDVFVPAGMMVGCSFVGMHYNPAYWHEPYAFRPERFLDSSWPRDAFMPFSGGARSCLGRRFFESEAVPLLALIVSRYRVSIPDDPKWAGVTDELARRDLVLDANQQLTLAPARLPLVFTRR